MKDSSQHKAESGDIHLKLVTMISASRTGSTHFLQLLERDWEVCNLLEAFHSSPRVSLQHIKRGIDNHTESQELIGKVRPPLFEDRRSDPLGFFRLLEANYGVKSAIVKVFPGHLEGDVLKDLLNQSAVVWVHRRAPLDAYLSNEKAKLTGSYTNLDTTKVLVEYDEMEFFEFCRRRAIFKDNLGPLLQSCGNVIYTDYLSLLDADVWEAQSAQIGSKADLQKRTIPLSIPMLAKQDLSADFYAKVSNPEVMRASLARLDEAIYL